MREQQVQTAILKYLKLKGASSIKVVNANRRGVSDIIACYKGRFLAIEVKKPDKAGNCSELQKLYLKEVKEAGGYSTEATSIEEVETLLRKVEYDMHKMCI